jgi:hypothetical protein
MSVAQNASRRLSRVYNIHRSLYPGKFKGSAQPRLRKANLKKCLCALSILALCTSKFGDHIEDPYSKTDRTKEQ